MAEAKLVKPNNPAEISRRMHNDNFDNNQSVSIENFRTLQDEVS